MKHRNAIAIASSVLARSICKIALYDACNEVAIAVAAAMTMIFTAVTVGAPDNPNPSTAKYQDVLIKVISYHGI